MSWQEVFHLSKRFKGVGSGENQVLGLYQDLGDNIQVLEHIAGTFSLQMFDSKAEKLLINSDGWKRVVKLVTDAIRSKTVTFSFQGNDAFDAFMVGKAAMTVDSPSLAQTLKNMLKPTSQASYFGYHRNIPGEFFKLYRPLLADALQAIIDNKKTVDEALAELEVKGQDALIKKNEEKIR